MKKLRLFKIEFWWFLEKLSGRLWGRWSGDRVSYWFDLFPAFFFMKRKEAEKSYVDRYKENIYGDPI